MKISSRSLVIIIFLIAVLIIGPSIIIIKKSLNFRNPKLIVRNSRVVSLGAWTGGLWNNKSKSLDLDKLHEFQSLISKKVSIAHYYRGWDELNKPGLSDQLYSINKNGWTPMISANPYFSLKCSENKEENIYQAITQGHCDSLILAIADNFKKYNKPVYFRFAWEMNIDSIQWSTQYTGSSPSEFVSAWRHIHDIFRENEVKNLKWVFSVNVEKANSPSIASLYPGDKYVDWIAIDGYNWGTTQNWSKWLSFKEVFQSTYDHLIRVAPKKPLMLSEVNSVNIGGNKAAWFQDMLSYQIPNNFKKVNMIIFFNEDKTKEEGINWNIENSHQVVEAIKNSLKNDIYK